MLDIAGAAEIPVTRLFGRSPAGMNATGESDLQNYYDMITERQESDLGPIIEKLIPIMCMSLYGAIPDDIDYEFNPIVETPEEDKAELASKMSAVVIDTYNAGLISQKIAMKELRQIEEKTGMFSNITDEDIEAADEEIEPPVEELTDNESLEFDTPEEE
jgi:phage-related protein (TIGR01555 family)